MPKDPVVPGASKADDSSKQGAAEPARSQGAQNPKNAVPTPSPAVEMPAVGAVASTSSRATVTPGETATAEAHPDLSRGKQDPRQPQLSDAARIANLEHALQKTNQELDLLRRQQARNEAARAATPQLTQAEAQKLANDTGRGQLSKDGYVMPTVKRVPAALMQIPQ